MPGKLLYELPEKRKDLIEIVSSIPSYWSWIDGRLFATRELYNSGKIATNTRLFISRFYSIKPTIQGVHDTPYEDHPIDVIEGEIFGPKIHDVLFGGKLFSSVVFDEAAFDTPNKITMDMVKKLVEEFLRMGYMGWISAFSGFRNYNKYDNPESFNFQYGEREWPTPTSKFTAPHISLEWNQEHFGKKENLEGILKVIKKLKLKEITLQNTI